MCAGTKCVLTACAFWTFLLFLAMMGTVLEDEGEGEGEAAVEGDDVRDSSGTAIPGAVTSIMASVVALQAE